MFMQVAYIDEYFIEYTDLHWIVCTWTDWNEGEKVFDQAIS